MDIDARPGDRDGSRLRAKERLRRLADLWPSLDDEERQLLEDQLHRLREKASA